MKAAESGGSAEHREHSINVCFSTTNAAISRLIRWATRSPTSHALITFRSSTLNRVLVMEAVAEGYRVIPWCRWKQSNTLVERHRLRSERVPVPKQCTALEEMAAHLGERFDFAGLLGFVRLLWLRTRVRFRNRLQEPSQLFCSEAVAMFLDRAGIKGFRPYASFTPGQLLEKVRENHDFFALEEARDGEPT